MSTRAVLCRNRRASRHRPREASEVLTARKSTVAVKNSQQSKTFCANNSVIRVSRVSAKKLSKIEKRDGASGFPPVPDDRANSRKSASRVDEGRKRLAPEKNREFDLTSGGNARRERKACVFFPETASRTRLVRSERPPRLRVRGAGFSARASASAPYRTSRRRQKRVPLSRALSATTTQRGVTPRGALPSRRRAKLAVATRTEQLLAVVLRARLDTRCARSCSCASR